MSPNNFILAAAVCGIAFAQDSVLMKGDVTQNGVSFSYETRLEPATPPFAGGFTGGAVTDPGGIHRYLAYQSEHKFFGYDLQVGPMMAGFSSWQNGAYSVNFLPLSIDPARVQLTDPGSWKVVELPAYPATQTFHGGDTIAIDLFVNPATGQKIVDYLHFLRSARAAKSYVIASGDVLFINVLQHPEVAETQEVARDGFISMRPIGQVKAAGLTVHQLASIITERLSKSFDHPEVDVQMVEAHVRKFYVSGEVRRPGSYPLTTPTTVLEAIVAAGGPSDFAKVKKIYVLRGKQRIPFNYLEVMKGNIMEQNILLQNGDVIVIP